LINRSETGWRLKHSIYVLITLLTLICPFQKALAHPTSSQGTISLMSENSEDMSHYDVIYSYKYWMSFGARLHEERPLNSSSDSALGTLGLLLFRDNGEDHQTNFYFQGGLGHTWFKDRADKTTADEFSYFHAFQLDYESRSIYGALKYENLQSESKTISEFYEARWGFAPYLAGYYDLNTWFILQATLDKSLNDKIEIAPFIRLFYKNVLTEFGSTIDGKFIFNFMVHY
jgi:hypothetical protein